MCWLSINAEFAFKLLSVFIMGEVKLCLNFSSDIYFLTITGASLLERSLKHKATLTGSGLIWAENSQRLSEEWFVLSLLLMCVYASAVQILLRQSASQQHLKVQKNESSGAVGVYGSYWCHLTACDQFLFLVPCCTTVFSCHFWTYLEKLVSILQIMMMIRRRRKRRRWRRRTGREIGASSS